MIVRFDDEDSLQAFVKTTPQASPITGKAMALIDIQDENVKQKVLQEKSLTRKTFAHTFSGTDTPFYLTGDIVLRPQDGISPQTILSQFQVHGQLVRETVTGAVVVRLDDWDSILDVANTIYESGSVKWCHPDFITIIERTTNDPLFDTQWGLKKAGQYGGASGIDIKAEGAWAITQGSANIRIAVIDDGVEDHPDLSGRVLQGFTPLNATSYGRPTTQFVPDVTIGHGEACAGIIAASHNTLGVAGISPNVRIVPINIFHTWVFSLIYMEYISVESVQDIASGIEFAWDPLRGNADVISNSWGYGGTPPNADYIADEINNAVTLGRLRNGVRLGCTVVFAAGNKNSTSITFPANLQDVVTVGAMCQCGTRKRSSSNPSDLNWGVHPDPLGVSCDGEKWWGSNYGNDLDLVAPGVRIGTTDREGNAGYVNGNYYGLFNGTSAACPHVSGVAALMLSVNPNLTREEMVVIIGATAQKIRSGSGNYNYQTTVGHPYGTWNNEMGYGLVSAHAAVYSAMPRIIGPSIVEEPCQATYTVNVPAGSTNILWNVRQGLVLLSSNSSSCTVARSSNVINPLSSVLWCTFDYNGQTYAAVKVVKIVPADPVIASGVYDLITHQAQAVAEVGKRYYFVAAMPSAVRPYILEYRWELDKRGMMYEFSGETTENDPVVFDQPGTYPLRLMVRDSCGWSDWAITNVDVQ